MPRDTRIGALATAVGAQVKTQRTSVCTHTHLTTGSKTDLVSAINEVRALAANAGGGGSDPWTVSWVDTAVSNSTTTAVDAIVGFQPAANTRYIVDALLIVTTAAATTGVQTSMLGPTSGVTRSAVKAVAATSAIADKIDHLALNSWQVTTAGITIPSLISIQGILDFGTPGTANVRVGLRSEVAGSAVAIQPGSSLRWRVAG